MTLKQDGRYNTTGLSEGEFEPGSRNRVLKNLIGIKKKREMNIIEWESLQKTFADAIQQYDTSHRFTTRDIVKLHKAWLSNIYPWAGQYRRVNVAKGNFHFAAANQISKLMQEFEKRQLKKYTPCTFSDLTKIKEAIAVVHTELILIHPFRDGNGRIARLLASLMALQAGLPLLNFKRLEGSQKQNYFKAVRSGMKNDYNPMIKIFDSVIKTTLKAASS